MKKTLSLIIAVLLLSVCILPLTASAAEKTDPGYIYFTPPANDGVTWSGFSKVYCHIWSKTDGEVYEWQSKKELCEDLGSGYWRYDLSGIDFDEKGEYSVVFSNDKGQQTYDLNITSSCPGDIVYCEGETVQSPSDDAKQCVAARWTNNTDVLPSVEVDSQGKTTDSDDIKPWGSGEGASYEMPEITSADTENNSIESTSENSGDNPDGINTNAATLWIIIVCVVVAGAIFAVVVYLGIKNKK